VGEGETGGRGEGAWERRRFLLCTLAPLLRRETGEVEDGKGDNGERKRGEWRKEKETRGAEVRR